jgi:hypothetical protein
VSPNRRVRLRRYPTPRWEIDLALSSLDGYSSAISISLATDSGGLPGTMLESWNLNGPFPPFSSTNDIVQTLTPTTPTLLLAGTEYWLVAASAASNTDVAWNGPSSAAAGTTLDVYNSGSWHEYAGDSVAFDVLGSNVLSTPEPNYISVLSLGLLAMGWAIRKRWA